MLSLARKEGKECVGSWREREKKINGEILTGPAGKRRKRRKGVYPSFFKQVRKEFRPSKGGTKEREGKKKYIFKKNSEKTAKIEVFVTSKEEGG